MASPSRDTADGGTGASLGRLVALVAVVLLFIVPALIYGALQFATSASRAPFAGPLPEADAEERALVPVLRQHVQKLAALERNLDNPAALEDAARYIERTLASYGITTVAHEFDAAGTRVRNIEAIFDSVPWSTYKEDLVVGAHYDTARGSPGANNNATGVAALIEIARLMRMRDIRLRLRVVFFVNGEPPHFRTERMGSLRYARALRGGRPLHGMISIDSLGYYATERGTQRHAPLVGLVLPDRGDFVAAIGLLGARPLMREVVGTFRVHTRFPSSGIVGPSFFSGTQISDNWAFAQEGFRAVSVSDTGPYRDPNFRRPTDTPDKIDYDRFSRVVLGLSHTTHAIVLRD